MESDDGYARFEPLSQDEATVLLRTHEVGRVAWDSTAGPMVIPVAYAFAKGAVAFRTASDGALAQLAETTEVAFEVDEFDVQTATGWSVLMRATTTVVGDPSEYAEWQRLLPTPWASGERELLIRLDPISVTGRVVVRG